MSREENRRQRERMIRRGLEIYTRLLAADMGQEERDRYLALQSRRHARTRCPCSQHCCGNPRRHSKGEERMTRKELQADVRTREQMRELNTNINDKEAA